MKKTVDYNLISTEYNKRYSVNSMQGIRSALVQLRNTYNPKTVLEVGCGTGRWLTEFDFGKTKIIGMDYSKGMLREASNFENVSLIRGDADNLPLKNNLFEMIYSVNAIHHFKNGLHFVSESEKHLTDNGFLCIIGLDHHEERIDWFIYDYFDGTYEYDKYRFPLFQDISLTMNSAGFINIDIKIIDTVNITRIGNEIFNDPFLAKMQSSQLAALSDDEYAKGIEKIKMKIKSNPKQEFKVQFAVKMITGFTSRSNKILS